jgi:hypothetical protein
LLYDENKFIPLQERVEMISNEYDKFNKLTLEEKEYLYNYALAGVVMEFMGAYQEKFIKGNTTEETEYWLNLGRNGLKKELSKKI